MNDFYNSKPDPLKDVDLLSLVIIILFKIIIILCMSWIALKILKSLIGVCGAGS